MGAWGTKPHENDTAADWFSSVTKSVSDDIERLLERKVSQEYYDEYRAAAWLLSRIGWNFIYDVNRRERHIKTLIDRLELIHADDSYVKSWESPKRFRLDIAVLIHELEAIDV